MRHPWIGLACILLLSSTTFGRQSSADLAQSIAESRKACERLQNASYREVFREWDKDGTLREVDVRVIRKDGQSYMDGGFPYTVVSTDGKRTATKQRITTVRNGSYVAAWDRGTKSAQQYENAASGFPTKRGLQLIETWRAPDISLLAAGDSARTIEGLKQLLDPKTRWDVEGPDSKGIIKINVYYSPPKQGVCYAFFIDSTKDNLLSRYEGRDDAGELAGYVNVQLAQSGVDWYPARIEKCVIVNQKPRRVMQIDVSDFKSNPQVSQEQFGLPALELEDGLTMTVVETSGKVRQVYVRDGKLFRLAPGDEVPPASTPLPAGGIPIRNEVTASARTGDAKFTIWTAIVAAGALIGGVLLSKRYRKSRNVL